MRLFRAVFLDVWKEKQSQSTAQIHVLQKRLRDLKGQEQRLIDALVHRREIKQAVFDEQHDRVQQEITLTQMHLNEVSQVELDVEAALNFTQQVFRNAARIMGGRYLDQKQKLQNVFFPEGVTFTAGTFETGTLCLAFNALQPSATSNVNLVSPTGFEPVLLP